MDHANEIAEYRCPGERGGISRAVHLGRLARFYPACRRCPHGNHRDENKGGQAAHGTHAGSTESGVRFRDEGVAGAHLNDLGPAEARRLAAAFGVRLRERQTESAEIPMAVLAGDGRPVTLELVAAAAEGLRWAGCHVVEIGPATSACLTMAIQRLQAEGGLLVGGSNRKSQAVGLKFWAPGACPISAGSDLEAIRRLFETGPDRPTRRFGSLRRFQAEADYLALFADYYHALRPLRVLVHSRCQPFLDHLGKLCEQVACRALPCPAPSRLAGQVLEHGAHFGVRVFGDGEQCVLLDERGLEVPAERLLVLLTRNFQEALLGGGSGSRFWYSFPGGFVAADALMTVTLLLKLLSRSDRPLSAILDTEAPVG